MTPAYAYGWGATGPSANNCQDPKPTPDILQETELTICSAEQSTQEGLVDGQLCAVGATSTTYSVIINHHSSTQDRKCYLVGRQWRPLVHQKRKPACPGGGHQLRPRLPHSASE